MKSSLLFLTVICLISILTLDSAFAQAPKTISYQGYLTDNNQEVVTDDDYSITFKIYDQAGGGNALWTESKTVGVAAGVFTAILGQLVPLNLAFDKQYWLGIAVNGTAELSPRTVLTASPYSLYATAVADGAVVTSSLANNSVTAEKLNTVGANVGETLVFDGQDISWAEAPNTGITSIVAGDGLVGGGAVGVVDLKIDEDAVETDMIADGAITADKIANESIDGEKIIVSTIKLSKLNTDAAAEGEVLGFDGTSAVWKMESGGVEPGGITNLELAEDAVETINILDEVVTLAKLAAESVDGSKIVPLSVISGNIEAAAISTSKIEDAAVTPDKIDSDGALTGQSLQFDGSAVVWGSGSVLDGSIDTDQLADLSVTSEKVAAGAITTGKIEAGAVTTAKLDATSVTTAKLEAGAVTEAKLGDLAVSNDKLGADAVLTKNILDGTISPVDLDPTGAVAGDVLKFDGISIAWSADAAAEREGSIDGLPMASVAADGSLIIEGDLRVSGNVEKGAGSFKIDHPLDPENKYLYHSFVESDDMLNIYNGNVYLDSEGRAVVSMPDWFEALNTEFRYQLTTIGGFAPVFIEKEIEQGSFTISGGTSGMKISWQVTGVRKDPYSNLNRIPVEQDKPAEMKGKLLHEEAYNKK